MGQTQMDLTAVPLTGSNLVIIFGGIIALLGIGLLVLQFINQFREARKPKTNTSRTVEQKLENDNRRLNELEKKMTTIEQAQTMTLQVLLVMLQHEITGDHVNDMQSTYNKLTDFLIQR